MRTPELFDYQETFIEAIEQIPDPVRACLYYRTGAGKSLTAVLGLLTLGCTEALVICPPSTFNQWETVGLQHGLVVRTMSHAKFRMRSTKLDRDVPVIADEFHMFGGQQGMGWRKLDALARGLRAPMLLLSATPNYNDAERVYCVQHILSPHVTKGGYLQFLYENCITQQNPFSQTPEVTGFKDYPDACAFLAGLSKVFHVADEAVIDLVDLPYRVDLPPEMVRYGLDVRRGRIFSSQMERRHVERVHGLIGDDGDLRPEPLRLLLPLLDVGVLVFSSHATVARALSTTLQRLEVEHQLMTGSSTHREKKEKLAAFLAPGGRKVLVGTSTLATGTDGLDRVCDRLVILDDTDDDALRRQLLGRILPRGATVVSDKEFFRLTPDL
jgi:hypothetical protein